MSITTVVFLLKVLAVLFLEILPNHILVRLEQLKKFFENGLDSLQHIRLKRNHESC